MGPRYNDPAALADASLFPFFATNAVAGGVVARLLTTSFSPDVRRPLVLAAIAAGTLLPEAILQTADYTRRSLRKLVGRVGGAIG